MDDHTRLAYSEVLPDEKGPTCAACLARAADYFAEHGITSIERLMTDNAWAYKYSLRDVCSDRGIQQIFIKPHCPWQNGKVERFNLAPWIEHYNNVRSHSALGAKPPVSRLLLT